MIMQTSGKPFPWMVRYDGTSIVDASLDNAPLVMAAHAMTAIKTHEFYPDDTFLAEHVLPICDAVAKFAASNLFRQESGTWVLAPVWHDVIEPEVSEINATFTSLWFLVILRKTIDYATRLGQGGTDLPLYRDILNNHRLEHSDVEYLHSAGITAAALPMASWLPFLLYPTEGTPFINRELFERTRSKYDFIDLYLRKQGDVQPWTCFMQAQSDLRRGAPADAAIGFRRGMQQIYGPGLFAEIGPQQETVGLPPYFSAHGTYIALQAYRLVSYSIWTREIGLFLGLDPDDRNNRIQFRDIRTVGGIRLSGTYSPQSIAVVLNGQLGGLRVLLPSLPGQREGVQVRVNGQVCRNVELGDGTTAIELPTGLITATVEVD
jgi:hypothetical protein